MGKFRRSPVDPLKKEQTAERIQNFNNGFILLLCAQPSAISDKHADVKLLASLKQNALGGWRRNNHTEKCKCWGEKSSSRALSWALAFIKERECHVSKQNPLNPYKRRGNLVRIGFLVMLLTFSASIFLRNITNKYFSRYSVIWGNNRNPEK